MSSPRVIVLLSGGLDSILAARILQEQNLVIEALNVRTPFDFSQEPAVKAAHDLEIPLTVRSVGEDYVELLRNPRYGFGKGANPCLDCHLYMTRMACQFMTERDACAVATGEVLGQRPMSQKRHNLDMISRRTGLEGRLLRPLSAHRLDPTIPEQEGIIDREKLYNFAGRARGPLIDLAKRLNVQHIPTPSPGCALTVKTFAPRVHDLFQFNEKVTLWDCELLTLGRHFRIDPAHKVILGRNAGENDQMVTLAMNENAVEATLIEPESFVGPNAILCGPATKQLCQLAGALMVNYTRQVDADCQEALVCVRQAQRKEAEIVGISMSEVAKLGETYQPIA